MLHKRLQINVSGCVQGVGFRPFVYRLAQQHNLVGSVLNTGRGVSIDVQGDGEVLKAFQRDLQTLKPKQAQIARIVVEELSLHQASGFEINKSQTSSDTTLALMPDTALCSTCLEELFDPQNRRFAYPFLHCAHCGPRFSLFEKMPFDRLNTAMRDFEMCQECLEEYTNPNDRRFFSQTNCCPTCGPKLRLLDHQKNVIGTDPVADTLEALKKGKIIAVKNTGGYLLLVDATNEEAVQRLRVRKMRKKKPFAVLAEIAQSKSIEHELLTSSGAPIVLMEKKLKLAPSVTCDSPYHGIMLPHTPLQYLLLRGVGHPLVATSGNLSGQPLCITEEEAFSQLSTVADLFLVHNRRILHRLDDSVVHIIADRPMLLRRGRGYVPYAISYPHTQNATILGVGGHQKSSFALYKGNHIYLSQHLGDLDALAGCFAYDQEVNSWENLLNTEASAGVADCHPGYYTTRFLEKKNIPSTSIQHHKAHALSCLLDNQLPLQPALCFSWDGTGLGDDRMIWGGEVFKMTEEGIERFATLYPFKLPGGEKAIKEPRRTALGILHVLEETPPWIGKAFTHEENTVLSTALEKGINAPICSSMGRLFDGLSALLECCLISQYEGEAALLLEGAALSFRGDVPEYKIPLIQENGLWIIDWRPMFHQILVDKRSKEAIACGFHRALAKTMVELAHKAGLKKTLLTGGVMQNKLLAECAIMQLRNEGYEPYWHEHIPPNDGGIAAGQLMGSLLCV